MKIDTRLIDFFKHRMTIFFCTILFLIFHITLALGDAPHVDSTKDYSTSPKNSQSFKDSSINSHESLHKFRNHFKDKYQHIDMNTTSSDVKRSRYGLSGSLSIGGDIVPQKATAINHSAEPNRHVRVRAIAKSFIEDEAALFDITNTDEIQEVNITTEKMPKGDYTYINYNRHIYGVELKNADMQIVIGPTENITSVQARLVAVPPEVYEAAKMKTLSEEEIRSIVETDLTSDDKSNYDILRKAESESRGNDKIILRRSFRKVAITTTPYVIWEVYYLRYKYSIDAFTGNILDKTDTIISQIPRKKPTSTDKKIQGDTHPPMPPPILTQ